MVDIIPILIIFVAVVQYGSYAEYTVAPACTTIAIPEEVSFEAGSTIPLAVFTAFAGLFVDLGIAPPPTFAKPFEDLSRKHEVESLSSGLLIQYTV